MMTGSPSSPAPRFRPRSTGRALRLLAIVPLLIAASPGADLAGTPAAASASSPAVPAVPAVAAPAASVLPDVHGLRPAVLAAALDSVACAASRGVAGRDDLLTIIDYTLPSTEPRLWVLDLARGEVLFHELVAHGAGTGDNYATRFSNVQDSRQTSLGLFLTGGTYHGGNGYSLKLQGLDKGVNDRAEERYIVMHGAWYVSPEHARANGRIGRSWGCPALSDEIAPAVIDTIKGGSFVFSYHEKDRTFQTALASSRSCPTSSGGGPVVAAAP
jgi:hypothetical protein